MTTSDAIKKKLGLTKDTIVVIKSFDEKRNDMTVEGTYIATCHDPCYTFYVPPSVLLLISQYETKPTNLPFTYIISFPMSTPFPPLLLYHFPRSHFPLSSFIISHVLIFHMFSFLFSHYFFSHSPRFSHFLQALLTRPKSKNSL